MTTQLVKKNFGGKRKGYKGIKGFLNRSFNPLAKGSKWWQRGNALSNDILGIIMGAGMLPMKKGGRVIGVGKATHRYGRAMRKRK